MTLETLMTVCEHLKRQGRVANIRNIALIQLGFFGAFRRRKWHMHGKVGVPIEMIRFAAANRLCIKFKYHGTNETVEPYALRQAIGGDLILCGLSHQSNDLVTYILKELKTVSVTEMGYSPKFKTEMASVG